MKKDIYINFSCIWPRRTKEQIIECFFSDIFEKYNFIISDEPDYLLISNDSTNFDYIGRDCIKIFYTNEPYHPNFNLFDYCIGFNQNIFDKSGRYLFFLGAFFGIAKFINGDLSFPEIKLIEAKEMLRNKDLFCDFTYNHDTSDRLRKHYLDLVNSYKHVTNSGIIYNDNSNKKISYNYVLKFATQKRCKFAICVESYCNDDGFITEKIFHAILSGCIPIYYGDVNIDSIVNPNRFINARKYNDLELLEIIERIDNDDELFLHIITQPPLNDCLFFKKQKESLNLFLCSIFDNNLKMAPKVIPSTKYFYDALRIGNTLYNSKIFKIALKMRGGVMKILKPHKHVSKIKSERRLTK